MERKQLKADKFDLAQLMKENLYAEDMEEHTHGSKISKAMRKLSEAASAFENVGLLNESEAVTFLIEKIAGIPEDIEVEL